MILFGRGYFGYCWEGYIGVGLMVGWRAVRGQDLERFPMIGTRSAPVQTNLDFIVKVGEGKKHTFSV